MHTTFSPIGSVLLILAVTGGHRWGKWFSGQCDRTGRGPELHRYAEHWVQPETYSPMQSSIVPLCPPTGLPSIKQGHCQLQRPLRETWSSLVASSFYLCSFGAPLGEWMESFRYGYLGRRHTSGHFGQGMFGTIESESGSLTDDLRRYSPFFFHCALTKPRNKD